MQLCATIVIFVRLCATIGIFVRLCGNVRHFRATLRKLCATLSNFEQHCATLGSICHFCLFGTTFDIFPCDMGPNTIVDAHACSNKSKRITGVTALKVPSGQVGILLKRNGVNCNENNLWSAHFCTISLLRGTLNPANFESCYTSKFSKVYFTLNLD